MKALPSVVAELNPAAFALVMATGIVSIAASLLAMNAVAIVLLWANALFFIVLWALLLLRCAFFFPRVAADLRNHAAVPASSRPWLARAYSAASCSSSPADMSNHLPSGSLGPSFGSSSCMLFSRPSQSGKRNRHWMPACTAAG